MDHHAPEVGPVAGDDELVTVASFGETPETPTAPFARRVFGEGASWPAAVGAVGDLGGAGFDVSECAGAPRGLVRKLVPLVNAPRRLADGPVRTALCAAHRARLNRRRARRRADRRTRARKHRVDEAFERAVRTCSIVPARETHRSRFLPTSERV